MDYDISQYARSLDGISSSSAYTSGSDTALIAIMTSFLATYMIVVLAIVVLQIIGMWKIFSKAGEKGWKSIIPIYNVITLLKICGISPWFIFIYLASIIPFIGWIAVLLFTIYQNYCLSKSFGKEAGFTVGLLFLQPIFLMILGFGSANYVGQYGKMQKTTVN